MNIFIFFVYFLTNLLFAGNPNGPVAEAIQPIEDPVNAPSRSFRKKILRLEIENLEKLRSMHADYVNNSFDRQIAHQMEKIRTWKTYAGKKNGEIHVKKLIEKFHKQEQKFQSDFEKKLRAEDEVFQKIKARSMQW